LIGKRTGWFQVLLLAGTAWSVLAGGSNVRADERSAWPDSAAAAAALEEVWSKGHLSAQVCRLVSGEWVLDRGPRTTQVRLRWAGNGGGLISDEVVPWTDAKALSKAVGDRAESLVAEAAARGYPLASVVVDSIAFGDRLELWLTRTRGPQVRIGDVRFSGDHHTREAFLKRVIGWRGSGPYRASDWRAAREHLWATGLFDQVDGPYLLMPEAPAAVSGADSAEADLLFELESGPAGRLAGVLGYAGSKRRLFGYVDLALGNLFGTGRAAEVRWQGQEEVESQFYLKWHEPYLLRFPISMDASLNQVIMDTLYAETTWGLDFGWSPTARWRLGAGWDWSRLVLGGEAGEHHRRQTARFSLAREVPQGYANPLGWAQRVVVSTTRGLAPDLKRGRWEGRLWGGWRRLGIWVQQDGALLAGADSLLQVDSYRLGGALSLRGTYEGAYRAFRYLLLRNEIGLRPATRPGPRFYLLCDVAWIRGWKSRTGSRYGYPIPSAWEWSAGIGLEVPTAAGDVGLDYAVPGGAGLSQGRIHFGLTSRF